MKGFMFSIEALFAVSIVILAIGIFANSAASNEVKTNNTQIQSTAQGQMVLYFDLGETGSNPLAKELYCEKVTDYNYTMNNLEDKNSCWWKR